MSFTATTRYALVNAAILLACAIEAFRGYKPLIIAIAGVAFLITGNVIVYLSGSKERAIRRQQKRDYYAGNL